jgi:hypothetical protein
MSAPVRIEMDRALAESLLAIVDCTMIAEELDTHGDAELIEDCKRVRSLVQSALKARKETQ